MSAKHSRASRRRWAGVSKDERAKRMSAIAKQRWDAMPVEQRKKIGRKLVKARKAKRDSAV